DRMIEGRMIEGRMIEDRMIEGRMIEAGSRFAIRMPGAEKAFTFTTDLGGPHLSKNLLTAYTALIALHGEDFTPSAKSIEHGWKRVSKETYYIGRWQTLRERNPLCIADSAHNAEGLIPVMERLESIGLPLHIVLGVVREKDLSKALPLFPKEATYYFVKADIPRGLPADQLRYAAAEAGLTGKTYPSVAAGYQAAQHAAVRTGGMVFVGGSIFTVAEVV
ncbi:MAG: hypothetical protein AAF597_19440, partial [Bacteroidota bacterium]